MWIDSHCHLDAPEFDADRDAVWQAARAAGVAEALVPAVCLSNCAAVTACCARYPGCLPAYGIHPLYVMAAQEADLAALADYLMRHRPVALGEIGLDAYVPNVDFARQEFFFAAQLELAQEFDLPVVLHGRRALDLLLKHLRRIRVKGGIAHAFNGSRQQADMLIGLGFRLGFGGALTYPGSTRIRRLAEELPAESLVLETDAPDIPPRWRSGQRNTPAEIPAIARELAALRGMTEAELAALTTTNTRMALHISAMYRHSRK
ncbi:MAG: TatD family hydrolase [Zoogloeaceae bacterium]|nr:TatD family hydrolase [Zoogloeaceae bacterium]